MKDKVADFLIKAGSLGYILNFIFRLIQVENPLTIIPRSICMCIVLLLINLMNIHKVKLDKMWATIWIIILLFISFFL